MRARKALGCHSSMAPAYANRTFDGTRFSRCALWRSGRLRVLVTTQRSCSRERHFTAAQPKKFSEPKYGLHAMAETRAFIFARLPAPQHQDNAVQRIASPELQRPGRLRQMVFVKVSILTPSFRNSDWLKLCVASVADQSDVEHEHIVQDA